MKSDKVHVKQWQECWTASDGSIIGCGDTEESARDDLARALAGRPIGLERAIIEALTDPDRVISFELSGSLIFGPGRYLCTIADDAAEEGFWPGTGDDLLSALLDAAGKVST